MDANGHQDSDTILFWERLHRGTIDFLSFFADRLSLPHLELALVSEMEGFSGAIL